ncbi:MAG: sulfur carrier protein ThiS [Bacteroides sp.]|nr:sulfur carrier protein ThiS [Bacteroides sp.]
MAEITVNGQAQEIDKPLTIAELIRLNNVLQPDMVSVQYNGEFVDRQEYATVVLHEGDEVDFLYFMGGGVHI